MRLRSYLLTYVVSTKQGMFPVTEEYFARWNAMLHLWLYRRDGRFVNVVMKEVEL